MLRKLLIKAIEGYQASGGQRRFAVDCNFEPTCSEYTKQALQRFGVIKGVWLGLKRIKRCNDPNCVHPHPDPVPDE